MKMDTHSKYICLIGILYIIGSILFAMDPIMTLIGKLNAQENGNYDLSTTELIFNIASIGFYVLMLSLAGLMIRGVMKQRHLLVAPFLVITSFILAAMIFVFSMDVFVEFRTSFYFFQDSLYTMGVQIMVLYPIYTLFVKLRSRSLKEKLAAESSFESEKKNVDMMTQKVCVL
ncbi:uncharacterized protein LOC135962544 [Calliphora vicina]|uniref:uncharacterized protein LOC135962544 n=1 Tax=Calliphora vicina TaxID=7373 RepID=UPI00325AD703